MANSYSIAATRQNIVILAEQSEVGGENSVESVSLYNLGPEHILLLEHRFSLTVQADELGDAQPTTRTVDLSTGVRWVEPGKKHSLFSASEMGTALRALEQLSAHGATLTEPGWRRALATAENPIAFATVVAGSGISRLELWMSHLDRLGTEPARHMADRGRKILHFTLEKIRLRAEGE